MAVPFSFEALAAFKYVIFDMDGTLLDSEPQHAKAWNAAGKPYGLPDISEDFLSQIGGIPTLDIAKHFYAEYHLDITPEELKDQKSQAYREQFMPQAQCFPYMVQLIDDLAAHGCHLAVATGSVLAESQPLLVKYGVMDKLETLVSADQITHGKPDPETYLEAARRLGAQPHQCVVFEDTPIGFKGVKAAGMHLVKVFGGRVISEILEPEEI